MITIKLLKCFFRKMVNQKKHYMYARFEKNSDSLFKHLAVISNRTINSLKLNDLQAIINQGLNNHFSPASMFQIKRLLIDIYSIAKVENVARKIEIPKFDNTVYFDIHIDDVRRLYKAILDYPDLV